MIDFHPFVSQALTSFLLAFSALFSIVNPIGGALIFNSINAHRTHGERSTLARRIAVYSLIVLLVSLWIGSYVLAFFGVSLGALRVAGGVAVAQGAWAMLTDPQQGERAKRSDATTGERGDDDPAFYPLTVPFTTGPGTISVAVALGTDRPSAPAALAEFLVGVSVAAVMIAATVLVLYRGAERVTTLLGAKGARIVTRLMAFLLLAIGVQILAHGVIDLVEPVLRRGMAASNGAP